MTKSGKKVVSHCIRQLFPHFLASWLPRQHHQERVEVGRWSDKQFNPVNHWWWIKWGREWREEKMIFSPRTKVTFNQMMFFVKSNWSMNWEYISFPMTSNDIQFWPLLSLPPFFIHSNSFLLFFSRSVGEKEQTVAFSFFSIHPPISLSLSLVRVCNERKIRWKNCLRRNGV